MRRAIPATLWLALMFWLGMCAGAVAQEHRHGDEVIPGAVGEFYATWKRPDAPHISCCDRKDCYASEARYINGRWQAKRREDGKWLTVPDEKIERNRDMPDARSHLCAPPPAQEHLYKNGVICFGTAAGG